MAAKKKKQRKFEERVWALPITVRSQAIVVGRLRSDRHGKAQSGFAKGGGRFGPLSAEGKARLRRIVKRTPEVMVKVTGRARGAGGHLRQHLDYISRNSELEVETNLGEIITGREALHELNDEWLLANEILQIGKGGEKAAQSINLILSMPSSAPRDRVQAAGRTWAREMLDGYDWVMARHDDTDHAHIHITVRAVGPDGRRLAPGPADLQLWREGFARELRRLGVEAEATPRNARGVMNRRPSLSATHMERNGHSSLATRKVTVLAAGDTARGSKAEIPGSKKINARREALTQAYLAHAASLKFGDDNDRQLARDIERFVAELPVARTRRQAMAEELRQVHKTSHSKNAHEAIAAPSPTEQLEPRSQVLPPAPPVSPEPVIPKPSSPKRRM
jgi:type IV secretion system T-DNA border endonuclease VirD2